MAGKQSKKCPKRGSKLAAKLKKKAKVVVINTPYDDAFRTMVTDCTVLLIPIINLVFGKNYDLNEKIVLHHNEHFIHKKGDIVEKRITDSYFTIAGDAYNLECQSTADNTMIIRIMEYAFESALEEASLTSNDTMEMTFPKTAVLYLRSDASTPDKMKHIIHFPEGDFTTYTSIMKIKDYTLGDMLKNKLYFLLPFLIFNYEKDLVEYDTNPEKLEELMQEYTEIFYQLEQAQEAGDLLQIHVACIRAMLKKVMNNLAMKYKNIRKGVDSIMGGKVLDYPGRSMYFAGESEGYKKGRAEGIDEGIDKTNARVARDMLLEKDQPFTIPMIAKISKLSEDIVRGIAASLGVKLA